LVVPDLRRVALDYIEGRLRAEYVVEELGLLPRNDRSPLHNWLSGFIQFPHKCMYDTPRLLEILGELGFEAKSRGPSTATSMIS